MRRVRPSAGKFAAGVMGKVQGGAPSLGPAAMQTKRMPRGFAKRAGMVAGRGYKRGGKP